MVDVPAFRSSGFVVLRSAFDASALTQEIDRSMDEGLVPSLVAARFRYVPMMNARTPVSLALLDRLEVVASELLGGPVLPTRAKGVRYWGDTAWHRDSEMDMASVGFAVYLEPLDAETGALCVRPGSHLGEGLPAHVVATTPGDVIAFDEHLFHSSAGGGTRTQWRVDFICDPVGAEAEARTRAYFGGIFPADFDGGYDVERYPSYGVDWLQSGRAAVRRLGELGVYELAAKQEAFR